MTTISWLIALKPYRHLSYHYILLKNEKFMVFTTTPVTGLKNHLISTINVEGKKENQYLVDNIHTVDETKMTISAYEKGLEFFIQNQAKLQPFIEKMSPMIEKISS